MKLANLTKFSHWLDYSKKLAKTANLTKFMHQFDRSAAQIDRNDEFGKSVGFDEISPG